MQNYLATEGRTWDTSTAYIRRAFRAAIDFGRRAQGQDGLELWEAYRLLGSGLHTMEDFLAHSNWCELALRKMGHGQVFSHVGDNGEILLERERPLVLTCIISLGQHPKWACTPADYGHVWRC